jgi:hypothetical protein
VTISLASSNFSWTFTGFYGNPDRKLQEESWRLLSHLGFLSRPAWLCIGDFNEIVDQSEKVGGAVRREIQLDQFRTTLLDCNLGDLGNYGTRYPWSNKRDAGEFIKERFDREVTTTSWSLQFLNASVEVLPVCNSDHKPMWLKFDKACVVSARLFCCEAKWNIDEERSSIVQEAWAYSGEAGRTSLGEVMRKISRCQRALSGWSRAKFGAFSKNINLLTKRLEKMQKVEHSGNLSSIYQIQSELNKLLEMEEVKWRQRAKRNWFQGGDCNTQYFHA